MLAPATACESQSTACDIEISWDDPRIGVNCVCNETCFTWIDKILSLKSNYRNVPISSALLTEAPQIGLQVDTK